MMTTFHLVSLALEKLRFCKRLMRRETVVSNANLKPSALQEHCDNRHGVANVVGMLAMMKIICVLNEPVMILV